MAVNVQGIGNALGAMGAGISGNLPAYMAAQNQEEKIRMEQGELRKKANFEDNRALMIALQKQDYDGAGMLLTQRYDALTQSGGDPTETMYAMKLLQTDPNQLLNETINFDASGVGGGYVEAMPDKYIDTRIDQDGRAFGQLPNGQFEEIETPARFPSGGGGVNVQITNPGGASTDKFAEKLGTLQADRFDKIYTDANSATDSLAQLNVMQSLGDNTPTGVFQANMFRLGQYVDSLLGEGTSKAFTNVDVDGFQIYNSLTQQIVNAELRDNKGIQTEGDAERARQTAASVNKTSAANEFITSNRRAIANRKIAQRDFFEQRLDPTSSNMAADFRRIEQEWTQYTLDTPMIIIPPEGGYLFVNDFINSLSKKESWAGASRDKLLEVWRAKDRGDK